MQNITIHINEISIYDFEKLDLKNLGLNNTDFLTVLDASKQLSKVSHLSIAEYGKDIAMRTSNYTDELLTLLSNAELDEAGTKLNQVIGAAKQLNKGKMLSGQRSGALYYIINKFKKLKNSIQEQFNNTKDQMDLLIKEIEVSEAGLKSKNNLLEQIYSATTTELHKLAILIAAGQLRIASLKNKVNQSCKDKQDFVLNNTISNLDKRINDFALLRQTSLQILPMIRIIQSNNILLINKYFAIKNITIPAWKNQITLAISLNEQKKSADMINNIDDTTSFLMRGNSSLLQANSMKAGKANHRTALDIETLNFAQDTLLKTMVSIKQIQKDGMTQRSLASESILTLQVALSTWL